MHTYPANAADLVIAGYAVAKTLGLVAALLAASQFTVSAHK